MNRHLPRLAAGLVAIFSALEVTRLLDVSASTVSSLSAGSRLLLAGYFVLVGLGLSLSMTGRTPAGPLLSHLWRGLRWPGLAGLLALHLFVIAYYSQQVVWPGPWTALLCTIGITGWVSALHSNAAQPELGRSAWAAGTLLFFATMAVSELNAALRPAPIWLAAATCLLLAVYLCYAPRLPAALITWRGSLGSLRKPFASVLLVTPLLYLWLAGPTVFLTFPNLLALLLLIAVAAAAFLLTDGPGLVDPVLGAVSLAIACLLAAFAGALTGAVNYPFSLTWSEGNRLYDYSLIFGQYIYRDYGSIEPLYNAPGRYALWGVLFLAPGLPIWVHRLWNILLGFLPVLLAGWLLVRGIPDVRRRLVVFLWFSLFFTIVTPLHPPFMIVAALVFAFMYERSLWIRGACLVLACVYASLSRWTWLPAAGVLGALIDLLFHYPERTSSIVRRLAPTAALLLLGILPGIPFRQSTLSTLAENTALSQPLLWDRLLPNQTYALGILPGVLIATGPILALLLWLVGSGRWRLDGFQRAGLIVVLAGFLVTGAVVSIKIGGGGDLHNMDMYLMALATATGIGAARLANGPIADWPGAARAGLALLLLLPAAALTPLNPRVASTPVLDVAGPEETRDALAVIRAAIEALPPGQEVLFMDQRQLVTFGYFHPEAFSNEYEKKFMMDQALAGDAAYFRTYYQDLAEGRYGLIISEPLKTQFKPGEDGFFGAENNAWVRWVSRPTLCFYKAAATFESARLQLLVPKERIPDQCAEYLR